MNVGRFSKHQNKKSDADSYQGFFAARVSQVNVKTMERVLSSGLTGRLLNVYVKSSSYDVPSALSFEIGTKRCSKGVLGLPTVLYSLRSVHVMRECMLTLLQARSGL